MTQHHDDHDHAADVLPQQLSEAAAAGCPESRLMISRRAVMGVSAGLFSWACLPRHAEAFAAEDQRLLIVLLRGGMDGMHVSYNSAEDQLLRDYRGSMFRDYSPTTDYLKSYINLGSTGFRLNGQMTSFASWFRQGDAAIVHAVAPPLQSRSHFDCADNLENGQPGRVNAEHNGWLNRFLRGLEANVPQSRALSDGSTPLIMMGAAPVQSWSSGILQSLGDKFTDSIMQTYINSGQILYRNMATKLQAGSATDKMARPSGTAVPAGKDTGVVTAFRGTARLMKDSNGPRVSVLSVGGLDTHNAQVRLLDGKLKNLDDGLAAFRAELGEAAWAKTVVCCVTEFGRTMRVNLAGTDHGTGTVALLAGGNVQGGKVFGQWPGIKALRDDRDLTATTDTRSLFKSLLSDHLGLRNTTYRDRLVFPRSKDVAPLAGIVKVPAATELQLSAKAVAAAAAAPV